MSTHLDPRAGTRFGKIPDHRDRVAANADVGAEPGRAGAVDDAASREDQIEDQQRRDHVGGVTTITPSSPTAPSTTARTGRAVRARVASPMRPGGTSLAV